jgi:hypothetical protein
VGSLNLCTRIAYLKHGEHCEGIIFDSIRFELDWIGPGFWTCGDSQFCIFPQCEEQKKLRSGVPLYYIFGILLDLAQGSWGNLVFNYWLAYELLVRIQAERSLSHCSRSTFTRNAFGKRVPGSLANPWRARQRVRHASRVFVFVDRLLILKFFGTGRSSPVQPSPFFSS